MAENIENNIILTRREFEILKLISEGYTIKELASKLNIKDTTVIFHRNNLREKFNARNCVELISKAYKTNLL